MNRSRVVRRGRSREEEQRGEEDEEEDDFEEEVEEDEERGSGLGESVLCASTAD